MKPHLIKSLLIILLMFFGQISKGETEDPPKKIGRDYYEKIKVDLKNGVIEGFQTLPFDVPFVFYGAVDSEIVSITVYYKQASSQVYTKDTQEVFVCNCDEDLKGMYRICQWKKTYYTSTQSQDSFYIAMPALKANAGYQFLFKLERKYSGHELRVINLEQKKVLLNSIRDNFKTIYHADPGQTRKGLNRIYSENLDKWINVLYSKNKKDKDGKSKVDFQYSKEKKIEFESEDRNVVSNLDWSKLANEIAVIKGELNGQAEYSKKIMKSWTVFRQDLNNFIDPKNKTEFEFPEKPWVLEIINGVDGDQNIKKAMLGKYNIKTDKLANFDDLETKLDSASVEEMYTNQKTFLEKLKTEYTTLEALNRNKKGWLTFSNILKQLYAEVLAYYNSTSVLRESYYKLTGQIDLLDAEDVLNYIDIKMPVVGSTIANFMTRAEYYITADIGIAYGMFNLGYSNNTTKKWDEVLPYTGVNFNLASINRQARYRYRKYKNICSTPFKSWWYVQSKKISIVSGVTFVSVEKTVNDVTYRKGLVGTSQNLALLSGVAYRLGDYGRISGGFVFSKQRDQNLLIEDYHLKATPYVSISLDLDVKKYIKNLTDLIFPGNE